MIEFVNLPSPLAFLSMPGGMEWWIIGVIGLLLFGKRLPEVGRSLGAGIVEFKRGLKGVTSDIEAESDKPAALPKAEPVDALPADSKETA
jgi:sec-independent protein translocase protein TatA